MLLSTRADSGAEGPDRHDFDENGSQSTVPPTPLSLPALHFCPLICGAKISNHLSNTIDTQFDLPYELEVRPCQEFGYEAGKSKLLATQVSIGRGRTRFLVPGESFSADVGPAANGDDAAEHEDVGFTDQPGRLLNLAGCLEIENEVSVGCAGALLTYLQRKRSSGFSIGQAVDGAGFAVKAIEMLSLEGTMSVIPFLFYSLIPRPRDIPSY